MTARRQLLGIAFVVVVVTLLAMTVAVYTGAFDREVPVTLQTDRVGNQLNPRSDVKVRGVIVGEVEEITSTGDGATVQLALQPDKASMIPANVQARLLPKTLFGEKFVSLVIPPQPAPQPLAAGAVIPQDRSETARELDRVLDGLLPLLQAIEPQKLATTLGSLAQGLEGRGDALGDTLVRFQTLVSQFNTELPNFTADIRELATFSDNLAAAAPDLLQALADLTVPLQTIAEDREQFALLSTVTTAADDLTEFLEANSENLIALADASRPTLETLARYSPEFPCLLEQLAGLVPLIDRAFGADTDEPGLHITLEVTMTRGPYRPGDEPEYLDDRGPMCYPIEIPGPQYPAGGPFKDGSFAPPAGMSVAGVQPIADMVLANSPAEQRLVGELIAMQTGGRPSEVPNWSTLLVGPLYRGTTVTAV